MSALVRWLAFSRDPASCLAQPLVDDVGARIELLAPDRRTAQQLAAERGLPSSAHVLSALEYAHLERCRQRNRARQAARI